MENYTQHITRTRIAIPRKRADLISRQRLLDALDELLDKKVIIIAAPAGYGKTSLLIDLADDLALPVCWYSLDALDQNISRFLEYFVASIQVKFPDFKTNIINVLHSSYQKEVDVDAMVTMLVNDIYDQITEHFIIMLDDYHLVVKDTQINQFLSRFLQNVEENCHIVFASRTLLALPDLPLMVARGLVGGLGFEELAFTTGETRELFFNNHHIVLSDTEAETLCKQTEGWITGLLLTAQTSITRLQAHEKSLRATGVNINDYFELIYNAQPQHIQQFLLYTSLLEDFDFNAVNQTVAKLFPELGKQYKACADHIFKANLFVQSVGLDGLSLRYHHLFLDYLQQKVRLEQADTYEKLQDIIAAYYRQTQQWEKAYEIYRKEGQLEKQIGLLEEGGLQMMFAGRNHTVQEWLAEIPEKIIIDRPGLGSLMGTVLSNGGNLQNSLDYLSNALDKLDSEEQPGIAARTMIRKAATLRTIGHYEEALNVALSALEIVKDNLEYRDIRAESYRIIGTCYTELRNPVSSLEFLQLALEDFSHLNKSDELAATYLNLGTTHYMLREYSKTKKYLLKNIDYWEKTGNNIWLSTVLNNMAVLQHLCGDIEDAFINFEKALQYSRLINNKRLEAVILNGIGDIYTDLDAFDEAKTLYQQSIEIGEEINAKYVILYALNGLALVSIYQNQYTLSNEIIQQAETLLKDLNSNYENNLISFTKGLLQYYLQEYSTANTIFKETLDLSKIDSYEELTGKVILYTLLTSCILGKDDEMFSIFFILQTYFQTDENQAFLFPSGIREEKVLKKISDHNEQFLVLSQWINKVENYKKQIPIFRRRIRRKAFLVPFAPARLEIISLGNMKVKFNDKWLTSSDWQTQSARDLFFLVLSQSNGLTKEEIGLQLWPEDSEQELKFHFKNAIYRVRHALSKDIIVLDGDQYFFNKSIDYHFDAEIFLKENIAITNTNNWKEKLLHYKNADNLYQGYYLPDIDADWIRTERNKLHNTYLQMLFAINETAFQNEEFDTVIKITEKILKFDPYNEETYRVGMRAQSAVGNRMEVEKLYKLCEKHLYEELNAPPSQKTKKLHQTLMKI